MKKLLLVLFLLAAILSNAATYYVSTTGNDANPGTIGSPFLTWEHLETVMVAGDNAYIRGGTYSSPRPTTDEYLIWIQNINGTSGSPCRIENYPGETPILDYSYISGATNSLYGLYFQYCNYLTIKGLRITGLAQPSNGSAVNVFTLDNCNNVTVELCVTDNSGGTGFVLLHSNNNLVLNCDAHHLGDGFSGWGGTNGFAITADINTSTNNTIRGCRAWEVSDNGYAFFGSRGVVTLENCWAFRIGWQPGTTSVGGDGVGFKLGRGYDGGGQSAQLLRILRNCVSFENRFIGFDQNINLSYQFIAELENCTAWQNGTNNTVGGYPYISGYNYDFHQGDRPYILTNNIGYVSDNNADINAEAVETTNSWQGFTVTSGDFVSLTSTGSDGARQANGSLPVLTFLHLAPGSDLIDGGTPSGTDLGAFEYSDPFVLIYKRGRLRFN